MKLIRTPRRKYNECTYKICSTKLYFLIKPVKTKHAIFHTSVACNSIINQNNVSSVVEFQRWLYVPKNQDFWKKIVIEFKKKVCAMFVNFWKKCLFPTVEYSKETMDTMDDSLSKSAKIVLSKSMSQIKRFFLDFFLFMNIKLGDHFW